MPNPFNPLNWLNLAQNWFSRTERSSGFRPYLIFLIILIGFVIVVFSFLKDQTLLVNLAIKALYFSIGGFIVLFAIKCFQEPNFCRSEKHIENVRRIEMMEQKGDTAPTLIDARNTELTPRPDHPQLPPTVGGDES